MDMNKNFIKKSCEYKDMHPDIPSKFLYIVNYAFMNFFGSLPDMHLLVIKVIVTYKYA